MHARYLFCGFPCAQAPRRLRATQLIQDDGVEDGLAHIRTCCGARSRTNCDKTQRAGSQRAGTSIITVAGRRGVNPLVA